MGIEIICSFIIGFLFATFLYFVVLREKIANYVFWDSYEDYGGMLEIDDRSKTYNLDLNCDMDELRDLKYVILTVCKKKKRLKRLEDINPLELEDENGVE